LDLEMGGRRKGGGGAVAVARKGRCSKFALHCGPSLQGVTEDCAQFGVLTVPKIHKIKPAATDRRKYFAF
jgi:hypothetical protein